MVEGYNPSRVKHEEEEEEEELSAPGKTREKKQRENENKKKMTFLSFTPVTSIAQRRYSRPFTRVTRAYSTARVMICVCVCVLHAL